MTAALSLVAAIIAVATLYMLMPVIIGAFRRSRAERKVICPETGEPAAVRLEATRAATSPFGRPELNLVDCSRWPERADCDRGCMRGIL